MSFPYLEGQDRSRDMALDGSWNRMAGPDRGMSSHLTLCLASLG